MRNGDRQPSLGERAARPTTYSDDQFADRTVRQIASEYQQDPKGDNRRRVEYSAKFYVVQLIGQWVNIVESAERTVRSRNGSRWVTFEKKEYELRRADDFKPFVSHFLQLGCYAYIGGTYVDHERNLRLIKPHRFIYISSTAALRIMNNMRSARKKTKQANIVKP
jgi:hypothetical protein